MSKIEEVADFKSELREKIEIMIYDCGGNIWYDYQSRTKNPGIKRTIDDIIALFIKQLPEELVSIHRANSINLAESYMDGWNECLADIKSRIE